ncbi:MAG: M48 family metalloprotease [Chitinophagaceae bacterium]|nr:M48 family metalloprotease [Chitinophagaceae bacterium]
MPSAVNNWVINPQVSTSLYHTLLHSLWQGLAAAVVVSLILMCTKKARSSVRYNLILTVFFLYLAGSVITFLRVWSNASFVAPVGFDIAALAVGEADLNSTMQDTLYKPWVTVKQVFNWLLTHSSLLLSIWFVVFTIKLARTSWNLYLTNRMRSHRITSNMLWQVKALKLAEAMGIKKTVLLLESAVAKTPLTIGFLKPVILVPAGLLTSLHPQEVEAVLLHELAHIKRNDYLVNLLQCGAEIVFFFNPALLWISSLLRREREFCCDDLAVSGTTDKRNYIKALVASGEYIPASKTAMAFAAVKGHLITRVKRIIGNEQGKSGVPERSVLVLGVLLIAITVLAMRPQPAIILKPGLEGSRGDAKSNKPGKAISLQMTTFYNNNNSMLPDICLVATDTIPTAPSAPPPPPVPIISELPPTPPAPPVPPTRGADTLPGNAISEEIAREINRAMREQLNIDSIVQKVMIEVREQKVMNDSVMIRMKEARKYANDARGQAKREEQWLKNMNRSRIDSIVNESRKAASNAARAAHEARKTMKEKMMLREQQEELRNQMNRLREQLNNLKLDSLFNKEIAQSFNFNFDFKMVPHHFNFDMEIPELHYYFSPKGKQKGKAKTLKKDKPQGK